MNENKNIIFLKESGFNENELALRQTVLIKFLRKISTTKKTALRRVKKKLFKSLFKKGDIITFKTDFGHYGISLIVADEFDEPTESGRNLVVVTEFESFEKPTLASINLNAIYVKYFSDHDGYRPFIGDLSARSWFLFKDEQFEIEVIGNIEVSSLNFCINNMAFNWSDLLKYSKAFVHEFEIRDRLKLIDFVKTK